MIANINLNLTMESIYIYANVGIIPFWLLLIFLPTNRTTQILVNSVIAPLLLAVAYGYIIYQIILVNDPIFNVFNLYLGLENLYTLFADERFLLIFWLHFLSLSLFLGSWVSRDAVKYNISRGLVLIPLIIIYLTGPIGLVLYWAIRIFYSKKIGFHD